MVLRQGQSVWQLERLCVALKHSLSRSDVVEVIAHGDKQIEEQRRPAVKHFHLHGAAALESAPAADDEGEVVSSQLGVVVGRVSVGVSGGGEDGAALDAGLCDEMSVMGLDEMKKGRSSTTYEVPASAVQHASTPPVRIAQRHSR